MFWLTGNRDPKKKCTKNKPEKIKIQHFQSASPLKKINATYDVYQWCTKNVEEKNIEQNLSKKIMIIDQTRQEWVQKEHEKTEKLIRISVYKDNKKQEIGNKEKQFRNTIFMFFQISSFSTFLFCTSHNIPQIAKVILEK